MVRRSRVSGQLVLPRPLLLLWLLPCARVGKGVTVTGPVLVRGRGKVIIGDDVVLDAHAVPIELTAGPGGLIEICDGAYLGPGTSIEALEMVTIGPGARVEAFVKIMDSNWHVTVCDRDGLRPSQVPPPVPVVVGAGATIGARSTLVPGSSLGAQSTVHPDSLVSRRVPPATTVGGVPARPVGGVG